MEAGVGTREPSKLPERFAVTGLYQYLAVCERFGRDPLTYHAAPGMDAWWWAMLTEYDAVRNQIDAGRAGA